MGRRLYISPIQTSGKSLAVENCRPIAITPFRNRILFVILAKRFGATAKLMMTSSFFELRIPAKVRGSLIFFDFVVRKTAAQMPVHILSLQCQCTYQTFVDFSSVFDTVNH